MTPAEVAQLVGRAMAAYPSMHKNVDPRVTAQVWDELLGHLPYDLAIIAIAKQISESEFFPTPAAILKQAEIIQGHTGQASFPSAEAAWQEVLYVVAKVGQYRTPTFTHPSIERAASALYGGWHNLCRNLTSQSMVADRAHFFRLYDSFTREDREQEELKRLPPKIQQMIQQRNKVNNPLLGDGHE